MRVDGCVDLQRRRCTIPLDICFYPSCTALGRASRPKDIPWFIQSQSRSAEACHPSVLKQISFGVCERSDLPSLAHETFTASMSVRQEGPSFSISSQRRVSSEYRSQATSPYVVADQSQEHLAHLGEFDRLPLTSRAIAGKQSPPISCGTNMYSGFCSQNQPTPPIGDARAAWSGTWDHDEG